MPSAAASATTPPLLVFGGVLQVRQVNGPEPVEVLAHLGHPFGTGLVHAAVAVPARGHESRLFEHAEVLADRRPADVEVLGDVTRRTFSRAHQIEDLATPRFREGAEGGI